MAAPAVEAAWRAERALAADVLAHPDEQGMVFIE